MTQCEECGYNWASPTEHAIAVVAAFPGHVSSLLHDLGALDTDERLRARPAASVWSPFEYIAHAGDAIAWYGQRIGRVVTTDRPTLEGLDWAARTDAERYHERQLQDVLSTVGRQCGRFAADLAALTATDWAREGTGSDGSPRTIANLAHRAAHEAQHHLHDIARGLTARRPKRTLLVSDLDGTLLRSDGTLGARTIDTVNAFIAGGGLFTYATARSYATASRATNGLNLTLPVITYGGAVIVDPTSGRPRPAQMVGQETARAVIELTETSSSLQPILFATHGSRDRVCWLAGKQTAGLDAFLAKRQGDSRLMPLQEWSDIDLAAVFYISIIGGHDPLAELRELIPNADVHVMFSQDVYSPTEWWIEISAAHGTKAAALTALTRELAVDELICFGDNHNDLPMFAIANHSVAVRNATSAALAAATQVISANDDEAVAHWIADTYGIQATPAR